MAKSGSEKRQRQIALKARFTEAEAELIRAQADRAGVSVAALIRYALLNQKPMRKSRAPTVDHEAVAMILGKLGQLSTALKECANAAQQSDSDRAVIDAVHRDLSDMRVALFEALGREP